MVPQLTMEQRRHWRISLGLMLGCLVSGIAVSNERGVFVPLHDLANTLAVTARAFAAMASPPGRMQLEPYENLLLSEGPALPPAPPEEDTPQAMMMRLLDSQPEPPPFTPEPPITGPIEPVLLSTTPDSPDIAPFKSIPPILPQLRMSDMPIIPGQTGPVPEPSRWAMLIAGFGAVGWILRRMSRKVRAATV
jgi:hypothetical protein